MPTPTSPSNVVDAIGTAEVILCLGSGGVGKTTTAAALAIALAGQGERVVVLTIDPARRLADALGQAGGLSNEPQLVGEGWRQPNAGESVPDTSGAVWATMLDPTETLTAIVESEVSDPATAKRILSNRLFTNLTTSLSGTNEYMATERLFQLVLDDRFDRVIVDTPPSRHAIDFLDSPGRLSRFVNHRLYRSVFAPKSGFLKTLSVGSQRLLGLLGRLVGSDLVDDVVSFFSDFDGLDEGFERRATTISDLLSSDRSAYVLITSPRSEPINEAQWILENLNQRSLDAHAIIVNRALPINVETGSSRARGDGPSSLGGEPSSKDPLAANFAQLSILADHQATLVKSLTGSFVTVLPEQDEPVTDLPGLAHLASTLTTSNKPS